MDENQPSLFDNDPVVQTELGIQQAAVKLDRDDGPEWLAEAIDTIVRVARAHEFFSTDDVWAAMDEPDDSDYRSQIGIAIREAKKLGIMVMHGYTESKRGPRHRSPLRVWRSLIYTGR